MVDPSSQQLSEATPETQQSAYDAKVATPDNLAARFATMEVALGQALSAIETINATQSVLADALRGYGLRVGGVEAVADDTNRRIVSLEKSIAEIKELLVRALDR